MQRKSRQYEPDELKATTLRPMDTWSSFANSVCQCPRSSRPMRLLTKCVHIQDLLECLSASRVVNQQSVQGGIITVLVGNECMDHDGEDFGEDFQDWDDQWPGTIASAVRVVPHAQRRGQEHACIYGAHFYSITITVASQYMHGGLQWPHGGQFTH